MSDQEICELCESGWRSVDGMTDYEIMPGVSKRVCIHCKAELEIGAAQKVKQIKAMQQNKAGGCILPLFIIGTIIIALI